MSKIALYNSKPIIDAGTGKICVSCCHTGLVACNLSVGGATNKVGITFEGIKKWNRVDSARVHRAVFRTEHIIYYATSAGIERTTIGSVFIDIISSSLFCRDVVVDSSGNMYVAHDRSSDVTVSKYNSSGVFQWGYDTGAISDGWRIALSSDETKVAVGISRGNPGDFTIVLEAATGNEVWTQAHFGDVNGIDFDAFGNVYVVRHAASAGNDVTTKYNADGTVGWNVVHFGAARIGHDIVTDSTFVYLIRTNTIYAYTVAENPAVPTTPILAWSRIVAGRAACMNAEGRLFIGSDSALWEADISNGDTLWGLTGSEVWDNTFGWAEKTQDIHAGARPVPLPWSCGLNMASGDVYLHNSIVYAANTTHASCGDALWAAGVYTIGDRVYYPSQTVSNAYILENNNKDGGDTSPPGADADWVVDNDEPGVGNHWTDYWDAAA